jgi:predicted transcriptional regulator
MLVLIMDEGYILSNKFRRVIFDGLMSGETDIDMIAKKHRIIPNVAKKIIDDLISGGIIEKKGIKYILTKDGEKLAENIRG